MTQDVHALVLSGGGASGAYEVGVMEALFGGCGHHGKLKAIDPQIFSGTSVGAFSAAVLASQFDLDCLAAVRHLRKLWTERIADSTDQRTNGVFRIRGDPLGVEGTMQRRLRTMARDVASEAKDWLWRGLSVGFSGQPMLQRYLRLFDAQELISTDPLEELVAATIEPGRILDSRARTLTVAATHWDRGKTWVFSNREILEPTLPLVPHYERRRLTEENARLAVLASAAIPGFFPPIRIGENSFVDGGLMMNTPLDPAIKAGANVLHVIRLEPRLAEIPLFRAPSSYETLERIMVAVPGDLIETDLKRAQAINGLIATARSFSRTLGGPSLNEVHDRLEATGVTEEDRTRMEGFLNQLSQLTEITIHVYQPSQRIGGATGLLDFRLGRIIELMELGFRDSVEHDCEAMGCVLPRSP